MRHADALLAQGCQRHGGDVVRQREGFRATVYRPSHTSDLQRTSAPKPDEPNAEVIDDHVLSAAAHHKAPITFDTSILDSAQFSSLNSHRHSLTLKGRVTAAIFAQHFRQVRSQSGNRDKFWQGRAKCIGGDQF